MEEKVKEAVIVIDGNKYIPVKQLMSEQPDVYWNKRSYLLGTMGSIGLWQVKEFYYWKNGTSKREAKLIEALGKIKDDLSDSNARSNYVLEQVINFANDASQ